MPICGPCIPRIPKKRGRSSTCFSAAGWAGPICIPRNMGIRACGCATFPTPSAPRSATSGWPVWCRPSTKSRWTTHCAASCTKPSPVRPTGCATKPSPAICRRAMWCMVDRFAPMSPPLCALNFALKSRACFKHCFNRRVQCAGPSAAAPPEHRRRHRWAGPAHRPSLRRAASASFSPCV